MNYIPNSKEDIKKMLETVGVSSIDELFKPLPEEILLKENLKIPEGLSDQEIEDYFRKRANENLKSLKSISFLGGGSYDHYVPAIVDYVSSMPQFYTAYTPYQPEVSQGTLQAIFEYQTLICQLTGMDVTNASMYDGATAFTEAVLMANRIRKGERVLLSPYINPFYIEVLKTYTKNYSIKLEFLERNESGKIDISELKEKLDKDVFCFAFQTPNFLGIVEDVEEISKIVKENSKAILVQTFTEALSLALLTPPGENGVDIVAGEGQSFGLKLNYGGPYLGIFSTKNSYVRKMPGRIVGETVDEDGKRGFVLTLSTREQHIKREKATSNICTNNGLCALMATVYLLWAGREGLRKIAERNVYFSHLFLEKLEERTPIKRKYDAPFFNEFVITLPTKGEIFYRKCSERGLFSGIPLEWFFKDMENEMLITITEKISEEDMDMGIKIFSEVLEELKNG